MRDENEEPIYTFNDKYMSYFVEQCITGGRVCAFNQYYKSIICGDILKTLSREIKFEGKVHYNIEAYMNYKRYHLKIIKEEYESSFIDFRDIDEEKLGKFIINKIGELPIIQFLKQFCLNDLKWSYDANSLYPSAMSDDLSLCPKIETGYAFTPYMNDEIVKKFTEGFFTQGSAFLKVKYYDPKNLIVQHLPLKERVKKMEIYRMRNVSIIGALTSVDIQEITETGGEVIENHEGVIYGENFKVSPFKKVIHKFFEIRQKHKDENIDVMHLLVKLIMNSLYGEQSAKILKRVSNVNLKLG